ncbi:MAG: HlyD family efflux transporter periplasmic adaptor subunit [Planctomycetota bacterium]
MNKKSSRYGSALPFVVIAVIAVALISFAAYYGLTMQTETKIIEPILAPVERGEFVSQVLDQGEVQSSENVEIRCEVRARNGSLNVIRVVPEGSRVNAGDFLVQLDSTSFEKELEQQNISLVNAETQVIQAESALASAIAIKNEYVKGTYEEEKLRIANAIAEADGLIATARQRKKQAEDTLAYSFKLRLKGYVTNQSYESAEFDVEKADIDLRKGNNDKELAEKQLIVLNEITYQKNIVQYDADIKAAQVKLDGERKALEVERQKKAEIEEMIANCTISVPENVFGQVVYAKESSRGGNDWVLEEGTTVRQNQVLIRLPNPDEMEVKALINEQSITQIENGMPCTIKVDALNDTTLKGIVTKVNQYAESSGWMSSSIRKYAVFVRIFDPPTALKPGMNASVTIQVQYEPDVLTAPIQAVYAVQSKKYCLLKTGDNEYETREISIGGDNSQIVFIEEGLEEGETLVMNPGGYKELMDLPELELEQRIELPENAQEIAKAAAEKKEKKASGGEPETGAAMIAAKDSDGDGKLTKEEVGQPISYFFGRADTDGDGFLSEAETDKVVETMKRMRTQGGPGGGGAGRPGGGGGRPGGGGGRPGGGQQK